MTASPDEAVGAGGGCCTPGGPSRDVDGRGGATLPEPAGAPADGPAMVALPGGSFRMGSDVSPYPADGEGPARTITLSPFEIASTTVSNEEFGTFVRATAWITDAERAGWSAVFHAGPVRGSEPHLVAPWWRRVVDACWRRPEGPGSDLRGREDHPVVHVSLRDARAYTEWAGCRLPTEAQWEFAARGGLEGQPFPWGTELVPDGEHRMNVWQGRFPDRDTADDGYAGTAPVDAYPPNGYGLFNMTGNVWEWCTDRFSRHYHRSRRAPRVDPVGPAAGEGRVLRGGSYLCHDSYCLRYRVSARTSSSPDTTASNVGFRCAR